MLEGKEFDSDIYEPVTSNVNFNLLTFGYIIIKFGDPTLRTGKRNFKISNPIWNKSSYYVYFVFKLFVQQINSLFFLIKKKI